MVEQREKPTLKTRTAGIALEILEWTDGLLLTQLRHVTYGFNRTGENNRKLPLRDSLTKGGLGLLSVGVLPIAAGAIAYGLTQRPEITATAVGAAYVAEGMALDFCEAIAFTQSTYFAEGLYGRWTYGLQRKLAQASGYPKATFPFWL